MGRGAKTQLRKPWTPESPYRQLERDVQFERPRTYNDAPAKHADDMTVVDTVCRIVIWKQEPSTLGQMTEGDARAEGFKASSGMTALHQYRRWWEETHGRWLLSRRVWVVYFEIEREEPIRYMARGAGTTQTREMAIDEVPLVPPAEVDRVNARRSLGLSHDQVVEQNKRAARARAAKLRDAELKARAKGIDIGAEVQAIDAHVETIRQKLNAAA